MLSCYALLEWLPSRLGRRPVPAAWWLLRQNKPPESNTFMNGLHPPPPACPSQRPQKSQPPLKRSECPDSFNGTLALVQVSLPALHQFVCHIYFASSQLEEFVETCYILFVTFVSPAAWSDVQPVVVNFLASVLVCPRPVYSKAPHYFHICYTSAFKFKSSLLPSKLSALLLGFWDRRSQFCL